MHRHHQGKTMNWLLRSGNAIDLNATFHQHRVYVSKICVLNENKAEITAITPCGRCGGAGGSDKWLHTGWTCHQCNGAGITGTRKVKLYSQSALDKLNVIAEKRRATLDAKRELLRQQKAQEQALAASKTQVDNQKRYPAAIAALLAFEGENTFLSDMKQKYNEGGAFTDRMADAILNTVKSAARRKQFDTIIAELEQRDTPVKPGRQEISGYILSLKWQAAMFGGSTLKMLVMDERGVKVFGSLPKGMSKHFPRDEHGDLLLHKARGVHVRFTATLAAKESRFFFATRPGKVFSVSSQ